MSVVSPIHAVGSFVHPFQSICGHCGVPWVTVTAPEERTALLRSGRKVEEAKRKNNKKQIRQNRNGYRWTNTCDQMFHTRPEQSRISPACPPAGSKGLNVAGLASATLSLGDHVSAASHKAPTGTDPRSVSLFGTFRASHFLLGTSVAVLWPGQDLAVVTQRDTVPTASVVLNSAWSTATGAWERPLVGASRFSGDGAGPGSVRANSQVTAGDNRYREGDVHSECHYSDRTLSMSSGR